MFRKTYKNGFFLDIVDYYELLHRYGSYVNSEPQTEDWAVDHIRDDWIMFDCGAHIGYYTMLFSLLAPRGRVYAFEASPESCAKLRRNLDYNARTHAHNYDNVELIPTALGDRDAGQVEETLYLSGGPDYGKTRAPFDFMTLDTFCESRQLARLDLVKIDVDGWDYEVLLGTRRAIQRLRPTLVVEVNYALEWRQHSPTDILQLLDELGYAYEVLDSPGPTNWVMTPREHAAEAPRHCRGGGLPGAVITH
jgi:FkbM family methyltransferase